MRILHISTRLILGGSQENTVLSCEGQARRGHEVHLAFGPIYGPEGSLLDRVTKFRSDDAAGPRPSGDGGDGGDGGRITTHVVPHLVREVNPIADVRCYHELCRLIREIKPDVVHTHSSKAGILGRAAAWNWSPLLEGGDRGVGSYQFPIEGKSTHSSSLRVGGRPAIVHTIHGPPFHANLPAHTNRLYIAAERFAVRRCHAIIGVCNAMVEQFVENKIGRPEQYHTVYSGMETGPFLHPAAGESRDDVRNALGLTSDDYVVGTVARLAEHKGHDDILDSLAEDLKAHPEWKLLWVGDGWWRERLIAKAKSLGLGDAPSTLSPHHPLTPLRAQLLLTGLVPPDRIPGLMRAMDVLVHPSYREGLPRTVPESLLCGTCPIAYDTDGTPEVCKEMTTGRLVRTGDKAGLGEAIRWAADNPVTRRLLAARGREECRARFAAPRMIDELDKVYRAALQQSLS